MSYYIPRLLEFLRRLSENNNRDWFREHKAEYDELRALWLADLQVMIDRMAVWEPGVARFTASQCAYRIYRDTRFSLDKTPFKVYFSAAVSPYGRHIERAGYYLQMDIRPGESGLYAGIWHPESATLKKLRHAVVDNIEEFEEVSAVDGAQWCGDRLKSAPQGWQKNHPNLEYLRMKDYGKLFQLDEAFFCDQSWPEKAADMFSRLKPFVDFLNYSIEE